MQVKKRDWKSRSRIFANLKRTDFDLLERVHYPPRRVNFFMKLGVKVHFFFSRERWERVKFFSLSLFSRNESKMCIFLGLVGFGSEDLQLSSRLLVGKFVPTLPPTNFLIISLILSDVFILFLSLLYRVWSGLWMMKVQVSEECLFFFVEFRLL